MREVEEAGSFESGAIEGRGSLKASIPCAAEDSLAYLGRAADDISYCVSDMEDGIDQASHPRPIFQRIRIGLKRAIRHLLF